MSSWKIDPQTGDYLTEDGAPIVTDSITTPAYFRLKVRRNAWMYAPDQKYGSDLYLIKKRPTPGQNGGLESVAERALQPLIDDGRASSVTVNLNKTVTTSRHNAILDINIVDANQKEQDLQLPSIIGG